MNFRLIFVITGLTMLYSSVLKAESFVSGIKNDAAVAAVAAGNLDTADASWWGFEEEDSTVALQAALDSGAPKVLIPYVGKPWITMPLKVRGNQAITLEPGVVVLAKKGEYKGGGDSVFRAVDAENIQFHGYGATIRMHKTDYQNPPYERAEWRMGISLNGCINILIEGLRIESSGGDGIYIGTNGKQQYCKDVVIRDVVCYDNHRQGISVIGAENLLIENSTFANTWGTAPGAGIDLEPDSKTQRLVNITIRNCIFEDNEGHEVLIYPKNLDQNSPPISIRFENCIMRKTTLDGVAEGIGRNASRHGWAGICVGAVHDYGPGGLIEFINCTVENTGKESVKIFDKSADQAKIRFVDCRFKDPWQLRHADYAGLRSPIFFEARRLYISERNGGVEFKDCHVWDDLNRPVMALAPKNSEYGLHDITGTIYTHGPHAPTQWVGQDSTGVDVKCIQVENNAPIFERLPDADAE